MDATRRSLWRLAAPLLFLLGLAATHEAPAREAADAKVDFAVPVRPDGPPIAVEFIGNASRLDTLLGVKPADLAPNAKGGRRSGPDAAFFRTRYPHYQRFRIGNLFVGYSCTDFDFQEMVVRGADGRVAYRFDQTLEMLGMMVAAGIKPHLALTGTPLALVPAGEQPIRHRTYGCVNAPAIDWSKAEPRERMADWWALQDAFFAALVERFGAAEVASWTFATWTEPMNPGRKLAHLVWPEAVIKAGRHDAAVASVVAASIDAAMKYKLHIRIGNLAGRVEQEYPALVAEIGRFPKGKAYLDYIDGYAISRYRTQPWRDIGSSLETAFELLRNPAMPDRPLFIDELGDLSGSDGVQPFEAASGLGGARFIASALERVFNRQEGTPRSPRSVAFWRTDIEPRARNVFTQPDDFLKSASSHVIDMFASLDGYTRLAATGPERRVVAGRRDGRVKAILLGGEAHDPADDEAAGAARPQTRTLTLSGLAANAEYAVTLTEIGRQNGNPISAFLGGASGYGQDAGGRFTRKGGKWALASPYWEACYYDEGAACAWRQKARAIEAPLVRGSKMRSDAAGKLTTSMVVDAAAIVMVDVVPAP